MIDLTDIFNFKKKAWKKAQNQEFSWWNGVATTGYKGRNREQFVAEFQKTWMLEQIEFMEKPINSWVNKTVVEFGPGPAGVVEYLEAKNKIAIEPLIDNYRKVFPHLNESKVNYYNCAAESCDEINDNIADLSICFNVLDHTYNPKKVIQNLVRISKKNADVLFQLNVFASEDEFKTKSGLHAELHPHSFTKDSITKLLEENGLKVIKSRISNGRNPEGEFFLIIHLTKL